MSTGQETAAPAAVPATNNEQSGPTQLPRTKLKDIPLRQIRESKVALRDVDKTDEQYIGLVDSIRTRGVLNPIVVRELGREEGEMVYGLVDGLQRYTASMDAGRDHIPAQVVELSDAAVLEAQIIANVHRVEMKHFQYSKQLQKILAENPFMTMAELAGRLAKSPSWLVDRLGLSKLPDNIGALVDEGKINLSNAYVLAKLPVEEQPNFVERAMTQQPAEFAPQVNSRVKEIRDARRQGRNPEGERFIPAAFLQKLGPIKQELEQPQAILHLIDTQKPKTPLDAAKLALMWVLHLDPISIEEGRRKYEEKKAADKDAKEKREKERLAKKTLAAQKTAHELQAKVHEQGLDLSQYAETEPEEVEAEA